jgi:N-acetylneuraminic acid mutarotase
MPSNKLQPKILSAVIFISLLFYLVAPVTAALPVLSPNQGAKPAPWMAWPANVTGMDVTPANRLSNRGPVSSPPSAPPQGPPTQPGSVQSGPIVSAPVTPGFFKGDLRKLPPLQPYSGEIRIVPLRLLPGAKNSRGAGKQESKGDATRNISPLHPGIPAQNMPAPIQNWEGLGNGDGVLPPDTVGDVGLTYYIQQVNLDNVAIFEKATGTLVAAFDLGSLWSDGTLCQTAGSGDPIVLYDSLADRWLISQFALTSTSFGPFFQCIAISAVSGDPITGGWYTYSFNVTNDGIGLPVEEFFNDYPKFGVWPDAYYMSANQFGTFGTFIGGAWALDRTAMLAGAPASKQYFAVDNDGGLLPSDLDGSAPPPPGSPDYFVSMIEGANTLRVYEFHVDWVTPANSTLTGPLSLATNPYDTDICPNFREQCIHQPDGSPQLEALSDRLMHRLAYRNFGSHGTLVLNHTVDVNGVGQAGILWYELRDSGAGWAIHQQGTYAGDAPNNEHRWMGSIAMDKNGNIALGYSVSGSNTYPTIRYTGRLVSDPPGILSQGETSIIAGGGTQTHPAARWGDYSAMSIDPSDDCTFWYTQEYMASTSQSGWQTRIASFKFPSCTTGPTGSIEGTVTNASASAPITGAQVTVDFFNTLTDGSGFYQLSYVPTGSYTMTASAYGYTSATVAGIEVFSGTTTIQDFALAPVPQVVVDGTVTDASTGWPLYAKINIIAPGGFNQTVYTDPENGSYNLSLAEGITHTFDVQSIIPGYNGETRLVVPLSGGSTENFSLAADIVACNAPGYSFDTFTLLLNEDFESGIPGNWTVVDNIGSCVWRDDDPGSRGNMTGGAGLFTIADSDFCGSGTSTDTELQTPILDASAYDILIVEYKNDYNDLGSTAQVDVFDGSTWTTIDDMSGSSFRGPETRIITTTAAVGSANARVRWHYAAGWDWWWEVDEVRIYGAGTCTPTAGGLVVGNVYDNNTLLALNGAVVRNDSGQTTTTSTTPDNPNVDDGFYALFSPAGEHVFTATLTRYIPDVQTLAVVQSDTIRQNFFLEAGQLNSSPAALEATVQLGSSTARPFTLTNTGRGTASFEFTELDGGREILAPGPGAPLQLKSGHFSPLWPGRVSSKESQVDGPGPERPIPPHAPPWTDIASYPIAIMDNTAAEYNGLIYSIGGYDGFNVLNSGYVYDPDSDAWSSIANMTGERGKPAAAFVDGLLYVVGGWDNFGILDPTLEIYDPASDSWRTGAAIPTAYAAATGVALDGRFYVIGGCDLFCGSTDVFRYDPGSDSWTVLAPYPEPVSWNACGAINGQIYCAGGTANSIELDHTYVYDPTIDTWTQLADMPQTQWGAGFIASQGLLYISGGVTDNFNTITNQGFYYDPGSDTWGVLQNSNNMAYRGGSACGFYKIGGATDFFFTLTPNAELYPGLTDCAAALDVPWLSEAPISGTVASLTSLPITISFDASVPEVDQPGQYFARLKINEDTPYALSNVPVTMTVVPASTWGKLDGIVSSLGHCDANPSPLKGAEVLLQSSSGMTWTSTTDISGTYKIWLDVDNNPLTATISAPNYLSQTLTDINVTAQMTTTQDVDLRLEVPCLGVNPADLKITVSLGMSRTLPLTLANSGAGVTNFELLELPGGYTSTLAPPMTIPDHIPATLLTGEASDRPAWGESPSLEERHLLDTQTTPAGFLPVIISDPAGDAALIDVTTVEALSTASDMMMRLRFSPGAGPTGAVGYIHLDTDQNPATGLPPTDLSGLPTQDIGFDYYLSLFNSPTSVDIFDANGIYIASVIPTLTTDALEFTIPLSALGNDDGLIDVTMVLGDFFGPTDWAPDAGHGSIILGDVPWLSEDPQTGNLAANIGNQLIDVILDASVVTQTGRYTATLLVGSDDPVNNRLGIPVTMRVVPYGVALTPLTASQSGDPGTTAIYTLRVINAGLLTDTFDVTLSGQAWPTSGPTTTESLAPGAQTDITVTVTIPTSALAQARDETTITLTSQAEPGISTAARLTTLANTVYGVNVTPPAGAKSGNAGAMVTYILHITNTGNITDTFVISGSGYNWPTVIPLERNISGTTITVGPLAVGASDTFEVNVFIPPTASEGEHDTATIHITSQASPGTLSTAVLTTTVSGGPEPPLISIYMPLIVKSE